MTAVMLRTVWLGWLLFLASLLLPAFTGFDLQGLISGVRAFFSFIFSFVIPGASSGDAGGDNSAFALPPITGWQAFMFSIATLAKLPEDGKHLYFQAAGLANLYLLASPIALRFRSAGWLTGVAAVGCAVVAYIASLYWFFELGALLYGYYVWLLSAVVVAVGLFGRAVGLRPTT